jgi:hypothetical protein
LLWDSTKQDFIFAQAFGEVGLRRRQGKDVYLQDD